MTATKNHTFFVMVSQPKLTASPMEKFFLSMSPSYSAGAGSARGPPQGNTTTVPGICDGNEDSQRGQAPLRKVAKGSGTYATRRAWPSVQSRRDAGATKQSALQRVTPGVVPALGEPVVVEVHRALRNHRDGRFQDQARVHVGAQHRVDRDGGPGLRRHRQTQQDVDSVRLHEGELDGGRLAVGVLDGEPFVEGAVHRVRARGALCEVELLARGRGAATEGAACRPAPPGACNCSRRDW